MAMSSSKTESSGNGEQATRLLDIYLARYPNTPFRRPDDDSIEKALATKASKGDVKAAEMLLRFRAARKPEVTSTGSLSLDELSEDQLRACEERARHLVALMEGIETDDSPEAQAVLAALHAYGLSRSRVQGAA